MSKSFNVLGYIYLVFFIFILFIYLFLYYFAIVVFIMLNHLGLCSMCDRGTLATVSNFVFNISDFQSIFDAIVFFVDVGHGPWLR